ncbi:DNA polymerase III subunit epsilon [Pandoraea pnomenusa]|uniref:3'-5' exonuclease n=1 Tax=Pandoraea pnomenusa TaxID=93220 RepID=UPI0004375C5C|nr:3'-5' exonuclease [Pandoraea pnomenusa]AHN74549.1 DNA polymerase III subunit epsilon [Pandoraea pnomenusa]
MSKVEVFISVDIEASGPIPGEYSMLSLGACLVDAPQRTFSVALAPISTNFEPEALAVTGLSLEELTLRGTPAEKAMADFATWVRSVCDEAESIPVFVGLNAPFDWSFVNYYFHRFTGSNPFGFSALDIKAYFMGATGCHWQDTKSSAIANLVRATLAGNHDALHDALYQAELFRLLRSNVVSTGVN